MTFVVDLGGVVVQGIVTPNAPRHRLIGVTFQSSVFITIWKSDVCVSIMTEIVISYIEATTCRMSIAGARIAPLRPPSGEASPCSTQSSTLVIEVRQIRLR